LRDGEGLIVAALYPFGRVVGVEVSETLCAIARDNLARVKKPLNCRNVEVICADCAEFQVPNDITVIYLYNPFTWSVLAKALENVRRSLEEAPRRVTIIYRGPDKTAESLQAYEWLTLRCKFSTLKGHGYALYDHIPPASVRVG